MDFPLGHSHIYDNPYATTLHLGSRMSLTEASKGTWQETHKLTRRAANACAVAAVSVCRLLFGAPQLTRAVCSIVLWENMEDRRGGEPGRRRAGGRGEDETRQAVTKEVAEPPS